jgi:uncharacterized protein (TIGR00290 family)
VTRPALLLSWSSGKDSAWCLQRLRELGEFEVVGLVTTFNTAADRVAMHGVRRELVEAQADAAGVPVCWVGLPAQCPNEEYETIMRSFARRALHQGVSHLAFGDLFLRDIRDYRERLLSGTGITPVLPLWRSDTGALADQMIAAGLRAYLSCIDTRRLARELAGRAYDEALLRDLPPDVDPCGENGEFHTFCYAGPMSARPIPVRCGECVERGEFLFTDLAPVRAW